MKTLHLPHFEFADDTRFCSILRSLPGSNGVVAGGIFPTYRFRWQLYLNSWRRLISYAWRAMRKAPRDTDVVVAYTHLVLLPFILARLTGFRPRLVLVSFIYTGRKSALVRYTRWLYFRILLNRVDLVVTHSSSESLHYARLFRQPPGKFAYIPLWVHVSESVEFHDEPALAVVSAGRSNRDYDTLIEAASKLEVPVKIICDSFHTSREIPRNVEILSNCHQEEYLQTLASARVVVIPLKDDGESSGQMVLLHSMALGKAVLITRTREIEEYVEDGRTALTCDKGSSSDLLRQLKRLMDDASLARALGYAARERFYSTHTLQAGLSSLGRLINERLAPGEGR